jgi:hypothetical protein
MRDVHQVVVVGMPRKNRRDVFGGREQRIYQAMIGHDRLGGDFSQSRIRIERRSQDGLAVISDQKAADPEKLYVYVLGVRWAKRDVDAQLMVGAAVDAG